MDYAKYKNFNPSERDLRVLRTAATRLEKKLSEKTKSQTQRARFMSLEKILDLTENLWFSSDPSRRNKRLYKISSIVFVLTYLSGRRAIDALRLRWEDVTWVKNTTGQFLSIEIRHSKSNLKRKDYLTCYVIKKHPNLNIRRRLAIWWRENQRPESGYN